MIPDDVINQIRDAVDIVSVIGQHVQLKKAGTSWKGLCPFHGEKSPSFNVSPIRRRFHCFGCQKGGDVFNFLMEIEGRSFVEVAEQLAARYNIEVPRIEESPELRKARGERVAMLELNKVAAAFFRATLADPERGKVGRDYLAQRAVADAVSDKFQLGYAPAAWGALADHLIAKRADLDLAVRLGLIAPRPSSGGYYDRYRDRLVCPVIVPGGDIVGFSARVIGKPPPSPDGSEPPKYINSPESTVYKKSKLLFGLAQAREGMQQHKRVVLVEGNFDVISLHQAGFSEVVAPLGTALTIEQVNVLKRLAERIVLVYDGDKAGYKATMHALQLCVEADVEVLVAARPGNAKSGGAGMLADGVDPDSLVASGGTAQLREAIDRAQGGVEFFAFEVWSKARGSVDARARALEDAARLVAKVATPVKRDLIVATLATALEVEVGVVRNAVARASGRPAQDQRGYPQQHAQPAPSPAAPKPPTTTAPPLTEELVVIGLLIDHPELIASTEADKALWLLTDGRLRDMYSAARDGKSLSEQTSMLPTSSAKVVLSGQFAGAQNARKQLADMAANLEILKKKHETKAHLANLVSSKHSPELARLHAQLAEADRKGDHETVARLTHEISSHRKQVD